MPDLPYLMLSFSVDEAHPDAGQVKAAMRTALQTRTFAWVVKNEAAVVQIPNLTDIDLVLADMMNIEQAFDPVFSCVAVFVPFQQLYWASDGLDEPAAVKAITGRDPVPA